MKKKFNKKIRYAVMGLGHIAQVAILPAFKQSEDSQLVSLISEDPVKLKKIGLKYNVKKDFLFDIKDFPACLEEAGVDVLYLATPNDTHCDLVIKALNQGVHVLCEKPLGVSVTQCEKMIKASEKNNKLLMTAYRLHFEQANLEVIKEASSKKLGELKIFNSTFTRQVKDKNNIRLNPQLLGGGPVWDIGIYCLNAARSIFRDEPIEVFAFAATAEKDRFSQTPEMVSVAMKFPKDRLANFMVSFGADSCSSYDVIGTKGRIHIEKAYEYVSGKEMITLKGDQKSKNKKYPRVDQFSAELDYFSSCVQEGEQPEPSGKEGMADVRVIEAILKSIETSAPVKLAPANGVLHPQISQVINNPPTTNKSKTVSIKSSH